LASSVELEVAGPYPWGQHPTPEQPAQKTPSMKLSQIDMPAMREALTQMPSGSKWEIVVPSAWGADVRTRMPPNVAAVFEVKLISVK
jgi:peptidylprolyl isomerase